MLANVLAVLLGSGSFVFYMAAFFYPEVHRRSDFLWSGLGLFYAVVLWFCAGQMTGAVLLGQLTAVILLLGLGWQTLTVRREKTPVYQQTPVVLTPEVVTDWAKNRLNQLRLVPNESVRPIRLQKRTLSDSSTARFGKRLDPRRRPVYEYEFVEDGIAAMPEPSVALTLEALEEPIEDTPAALEPAAEPDYGAPPAAEAKILSVETPEVAAVPEPSEAEVDFAEAASEPARLDQSEVTSEVTSEIRSEIKGEVESEINLSDIVEAATSQSEADSFTIDKPIDEPGSDETEAPVPEVRSGPAQVSDSDDWGDDLFEPVQAMPDAPAGRTVREKPSLLAAPLILIGWVKELVTGFARPKPAKPVIDIPRRSPPPVSNQPPPDQASAPPEAYSPDDLPVEPPLELTEEDGWEESNWDD